MAAVANLGCCGLGILAPVGGALTPLATSWGYEVMYASLGLTLLSLGVRGWRARRPWPFVLGASGALALLAAFHEAWPVDVFATLVWGGAGALVVAVALDVRRGPCSNPGLRRLES